MNAAFTNECLKILADESVPEETRIDSVETFVRNVAGSTMSETEIERAVLDLLWGHFHGRKPTLDTSSLNSTPSAPINLPESAHNPDKRGASGKKQKWVTVDLQDIPESPPKALPLFDTLRQAVGENITDQALERALSQTDFDIGRTIQVLQGIPEGGAERYSKSQAASRIVCRYYLKSGTCLRGSDCMYSHDVGKRICRFWVRGSCMAGSSCPFLHELPEELLQTAAKKPVPTQIAVKLPALGQSRPTKTFTPFANTFVPSAANQGSQNSQEDSFIKLRAPMHIPWKDPGFLSNAEYVDLRVTAAKFGDMRNKFLALATRAWAANDPASAKKLSAKGQGYNDQMLDTYEQARQVIDRQTDEPGAEWYVDLHGFEIEDAVLHLEHILAQAARRKADPRAVYVICGRGHYKKTAHVDQLTQQVRLFLDRSLYLHKQFAEHDLFGRVIGVDPFSSLRKTS